LRVAELVELRWEQVDFRTATLHVRRVTQGTPSTHPIVGDELGRWRLQREQKSKSPFVFTSERGAPFTTAGFARMIDPQNEVMTIRPSSVPAFISLNTWLMSSSFIL